MVSEDVRERIVSYIRHQAAKPTEAIAALVADSQGRLVEVVSGCDEAAASRSPGPDEWSMRELVRHVIAAERGVTALVETLARSQRPQGERRTGSMAGDAPYTTLLGELRATNERMLAAIRGLPAETDLVATAAHPFFGELNCKEWAAFQRVHDEDHIQHARKIAGGA